MIILMYWPNVDTLMNRFDCFDGERNTFNDLLIVSNEIKWKLIQLLDFCLMHWPNILLLMSEMSISKKKNIQHGMLWDIHISYVYLDTKNNIIYLLLLLWKEWVYIRLFFFFFSLNLLNNKKMNIYQIYSEYTTKSIAPT